MPIAGVRYSIVGIIALLSLSACTDLTAVEDSGPIHLGITPRFAAATIQTSLPGPTAYTITTSVSLPTVTNPTIAYLSVSGDINVYQNYPTPGPLVGVIPPGGGHQGLQTTNCYGQVQIWYQYGGSYNVGTDCVGGVRTTPIKMQGIGQASRGSGYPGASPPSCGFYPYTPCYYYTGSSQSITITPIDMQLKLKPSRYVVTSGMSVTFNAFGTPDSVYPYKLPFTVQSWQWTPDSGTASTPCSAGVTACVRTVTSSGTMKVTALVNGEVKSESVHVRVLCGLTGDSLLNTLPFLDAMKTVWDSGYTPNPRNRREWWWWVDCNNSGACMLGKILIPGSTRCKSPGPPPEPLPGYTRKGQGHVHPFIPYPPDPFDAYEPILAEDCPGWAPPGDTTHAIGRGPSPLDYQFSEPPGGEGRRMCAIDAANIYCWPGSTDVPTARQQTDTIPRGTGSCKIVLNDPEDSGSYDVYFDKLTMEVV